MRASILLALIFGLAGCASNGERIDELAAQAHLHRREVQVGSFKTVIYERRASDRSTRPFIIFLEGDGVPWLRGVIPNLDPTTRDPLALKLLMNTNANAAYVARPCYQEIKSAGCTPDLWTDGRYSQQVVDVIAGAVKQVLEQNRAEHVALLGFSGGGTLAVLVAERVPVVETVITLAANLDTDTWTAYHDYLSLGTSLNPARSEHEHSFKEIHLIGRLDSVVPIQTRQAYFSRYPAAIEIVLDTYTHSCCWLEEWPEVSKRLDAELGFALLNP
jgi:pimeloyl-ACP methyl ester carboxylesterase